MLVLIHVVVALGSLVSAALAFISPSENKIRLNYLLIGITFATGSYLILRDSAHILSSCLTGLIYLGSVSVMTFLARIKLVKNKE